METVKTNEVIKFILGEQIDSKNAGAFGQELFQELAGSEGREILIDARNL